VKEAIGTHYSNLGFAIEDIRGLNSIFNSWEESKENVQMRTG